MLNLVLGRSGTGKTEHCIASALGCAEKGIRSIILVPEQSSFAAEREVSRRFAGSLAGFTEVMSFKKLCARLFDELGGVARERVSQAARVCFVRRALVSLGGEIKLFRRHRRDRSFYTMVSELIGELKNVCITPEQLLDASLRCQKPLTAQKLREVSLILGRYDELLGSGRLDTASEMDAACALIPKSTLFADRQVYVDGFSGFSTPQCSLLCEAAREAREVTVTLTLDAFDSPDDGCFSLTARSARRLYALAKGAGLDCGVTVLPPTAHKKGAGVRSLEGYIAAGTPPRCSDGLCFYEADDVYDEAYVTAAEIRRLAASQGCRFDEIAVVVRDLERYRAAYERAFLSYGVPFFTDSNKNLSYSPVVVFFRAALGLCSAFTTERVLGLLKSGLTDVDGGDVSLLENYCFVWDPDGDDWFKPFTGPPDGYNDKSEGSDELLLRINNVRRRLAEALEPFYGQVRAQKSAGEQLTACYRLLVRLGGLKRITDAGDDAVREANLAFSALGQLYELVRGDEMSPAETAELLGVIAASTPLGDVPLRAGCVTLCDAARSRVEGARAVFVSGLNEGVFPAAPAEPPLLSYREREMLGELGAELPTSFANDEGAERFYLYRALSCADERVYLSCCKTAPSGAPLQPSAELADIRAAFEPGPFPITLTRFGGVVNERTAADFFARALYRGDRGAAAAVLSRFPEACRAVQGASGEPELSLKNPSNAAALIGERAVLSPSRIEDYEQCPFSFFMRSMLRILPLQKAEISPASAGTFVHAVTEGVMRRLGGDIRRVPDGQLRAACDDAAEEFVAAVLGESAARPRVRYLADRLKAQSVRLMAHIKAEQLQSGFTPRDFELPIGGQGGVRPLVFTSAAGHAVELVGRVDRVDVYESEDEKSYLRVVDYKTGAKDFSLSDVYYGLDSQMLVYLFTLCENSDGRYGGAPVPSGVLYLPADPKLPGADSPDDADVKKSYCAKGLILDDERVIRAMERDDAGVYIPKRSAKTMHRFASSEKFSRIRAHIEKLVCDMADGIYGGDIAPLPAQKKREDQSPCEYCGYRAVCRRDRITRTRQLDPVSDPFGEEDKK